MNKFNGEIHDFHFKAPPFNEELIVSSGKAEIRFIIRLLGGMATVWLYHYPRVRDADVMRAQLSVDNSIFMAWQTPAVLGHDCILWHTNVSVAYLSPGMSITLNIAY